MICHAMSGGSHETLYRRAGSKPDHPPAGMHRRLCRRGQFGTRRRYFRRHVGPRRARLRCRARGDGPSWLLPRYDKATIHEIDAMQRNYRKSVPPKPRGRRWHSTTTAALHKADDKRVTLQVGLQTARLAAFGVQRSSTYVASTRWARIGSPPRPI
jgi:hypothetical protein